MPNKHFCQGPTCHEKTTQDRWNSGIDDQGNDRTSMYSYFCTQGCYNDFANKYVREVIAIAPRTEALETPINVTKEQATGWSGHTYMETKITRVDNDVG